MNPQPTFQLPGQWSTAAPEVDWMYYFIYWLSVALFVGVVGAAVYFCIKYRRRPGVKATPTGHNTPLEVAWTVAPVILLAVLFHYGFKGWLHLRIPPGNAIEIRVRASRYSWDFEYPNGAHSSNVLHIPVHRPVRVVISSADVLHSFFIPQFRIKQDATPGSYQTAWFEATHTTQPGHPLDIFCAEYCGASGPEANATGHWAMRGTVLVESQAEFDRFMTESLGPRIINGVPETPVQWGQRLYNEQPCHTCHSTNGSPMSGPTWQHLWGRHETMQDGETVVVDENYIRQSILQPNAKVVRGFQPVMPTFQGILTDRQIEAITAYIRSLQ